MKKEERYYNSKFHDFNFSSVPPALVIVCASLLSMEITKVLTPSLLGAYDF